MEYWNGTAAMSGTGRPVDAIVIPVAPFAAAREKKYKYYGYSMIFNTLDYTSWYVSLTPVFIVRGYEVACSYVESVTWHLAALRLA